jgi:hypothetical protein
MATNPNIDTDYARHLTALIRFHLAGMRSKALTDSKAIMHIERAVEDLDALIGAPPAVRTGVTPRTEDTPEFKQAAKLAAK